MLGNPPSGKKFDKITLFYPIGKFDRVSQLGFKSVRPHSEALSW